MITYASISSRFSMFRKSSQPSPLVYFCYLLFSAICFADQISRLRDCLTWYPITDGYNVHILAMAAKIQVTLSPGAYAYQAYSYFLSFFAAAANNLAGVSSSDKPSRPLLCS